MSCFYCALQCDGRALQCGRCMGVAVPKVLVDASLGVCCAQVAYAKAHQCELSFALPSAIPVFSRPRSSIGLVWLDFSLDGTVYGVLLLSCSHVEMFLPLEIWSCSNLFLLFSIQVVL
ncbi:hypothetical protein U1Q18_013518 [Sarracenia purpurea var. burkii]